MLALAKKVTGSSSQISLPNTEEVTVKVGTGVINMLKAAESSLHPAGAAAVNRS